MRGATARVATHVLPRCQMDGTSVLCLLSARTHLLVATLNLRSRSAALPATNAPPPASALHEAARAVSTAPSDAPSPFSAGRGPTALPTHRLLSRVLWLNAQTTSSAPLCRASRIVVTRTV